MARLWAGSRDGLLLPFDVWASARKDRTLSPLRVLGLRGLAGGLWLGMTQISGDA